MRSAVDRETHHRRATSLGEMYGLVPSVRSLSLMRNLFGRSRSLASACTSISRRHTGPASAPPSTASSTPTCPFEKRPPPALLICLILQRQHWPGRDDSAARVLPP